MKVTINVDKEGKPILEISYSPDNNQLEDNLMELFIKGGMEHGIKVVDNNHTSSRAGVVSDDQKFKIVIKK